MNLNLWVKPKGIGANRRPVLVHFWSIWPMAFRFFLGPNRAVVPKSTDEANGCILRHVTPKTLQKALYVGSFESGQPQQVVGLGWSQFPFPEAPLAGQAGSNLRTPCGV